jgi:IstB-like ATP binding protein
MVRENTAILDRVLHHAVTINIRGNSYRLKDKLKVGLVKPVEATATVDALAAHAEGAPTPRMAKPAKAKRRAPKSTRKKRAKS